MKRFRWIADFSVARSCAGAVDPVRVVSSVPRPQPVNCLLYLLLEMARREVRPRRPPRMGSLGLGRQVSGAVAGIAGILPPLVGCRRLVYFDRSISSSCLNRMFGFTDAALHPIFTGHSSISGPRFTANDTQRVRVPMAISSRISRMCALEHVRGVRPVGAAPCSGSPPVIRSVCPRSVSDDCQQKCPEIVRVWRKPAFAIS